MSTAATSETEQRVEAVTYGELGALPEILDVLVVGGGPAGTAAAFRCRELGLDVLVVDYDDLMKRIRDYSKDKLILPSFGGGDRQRFPAGGELVSRLRFQPIDKDDLCLRWKGLYQSEAIPARVGIELLGLARGSDGVLDVKTFDHARRREHTFRARHLVIAIGRGVPRRFDIPGNVDGIAYRLSDPQHFVGAPACVMGGGTSAAEAVIAISHAKIKAADSSPICWSYRGDRMPRVSKALAEEFFEAYVGNGNIRYYPKSEPAAVLLGDDRREYLAVRTDRRCIDGRPNETTHLEFPKAHCIACIGEDLPEQLLASIGISMVVGGPKAKKRMVTNRFLESMQPNVYLIGDLLCQAYFETDDFDSDPVQFREIKHRGNVKSALRDGVRVAQIIAQRAAGKTEIDVSIEDGEADATVSAVVPVISSESEVLGESAERLEDAEVRDADSRAVILRILPGGVQGEEFSLRAEGVTTIGRTDCDIVFPNDTFLSTPHASISHTEEGYFLRDDGGRTGVFLRLPIAVPWPLENRDLVRLGRQFLLFETEGESPRVVHYDAEGSEVGQYPLSEGTVVLGRRAPDITLDGEDRTLSRRHIAIAMESGVVRVKDLKSANGTFLRVRSATPIEHGQQFRVGQQALALSVGDAVVDAEPLPTPPAMPTGEFAVPESEAGQGLTVTFRPSGQTVRVQPGQTLCEAAEAAGVAITAECHSGICGSDPIRILEGAEHLEPLEEQEKETLEEICELEPGSRRLACMSRINGPVVVEILGD